MSQKISNDSSIQESDWSKKSKHILNAMNNFAEMLDSGKFSDAKLVVGEKILRVHKNILSARSRVFSYMFESNIGLPNISITIDDLDYELMQDVLRFIYTGWVDVTEETVNDLLYAAGLYEINGLKKLCEEYLIEKISINTVRVMLITADNYKTEELKQRLFEFIKNNSKDIVQTEDFKSTFKLLSPNMLADYLKCLNKSE